MGLYFYNWENSFIFSDDKMTEIHKNKTPGGEILLYQTPGGSTEIDVKFENDTVWLTQEQMAKLFDKSKKTINEHVVNVYREWELLENETMYKTRISGNSGLSTKPTNLYNLDVIISVGYRVKSSRWTQFRIRATQRLRDYLIKWYALNQKRLEENKLTELEHIVALIKKNIKHAWLSHQETAWLLEVITHYAHSWILLQKYDEDQLPLPLLHKDVKTELTYQEAKKAIEEMKKKFLPEGNVSEMFGIERNNEFKWILESIYQWFGWVDIYPSVEEKAAYLLFFIIKNHPFTDGNKKIWAFLFLWFLAKNNCLYKTDGSKKIDDHTLVAITLLVATCDNNQKDIIIKLILNFLKE